VPPASAMVSGEETVIEAMPLPVGEGRDHRGLRVRAAADGDGLTVVEASRIGNRENAVAPAAVSALTVVAPAVPTVAISAVSRFAPESIRTVSPGLKPSTLATLILVAPATEAKDRVVAGDVTKSLQLLPVSAPSGNRPALVFDALAGANGLAPATSPGAAT
jgi:hypothetical protein